MRLLIASTKGGSSKTTLAVCLASIFAEAGEVVLVDTDPQGSATDWARTAAAADDPLPFDVVTAPASGAPARIERAARSGATVVVDSAPGAGAGLAQLLGAADLCLVPARPSGLDLARVQPTLALAARARVPASVVLTQTAPLERLTAEARAHLTGLRVPMVLSEIPRRAAIAALFGSTPRGEVLDLFRPIAAEIALAHRQTKKKRG